MEFLQFAVNVNNDFYNVVKPENIEMYDDDCEYSTINPDDFFNESFLNELKTESDTTRKSVSSESSCENISNSQLTPPISPNPIVVENNQICQGIQIIPIIPKIKSIVPIIPKIKPIVPKPSSSVNNSSSDSETTQNYQTINNLSSKTSSPVDKALIKQARLIRNRESALQSRRKKKEYLQNLEIEVNNLRKENDSLKNENSLLRAKLKEYGNFTCRCASSLSSKLPNRNASLMLALIFMVGLNAVPFVGNILFTKETSIKAQTNVFSARHLLFSNGTIEGAGSNFSSDAEIDVNNNSNNIPLQYMNQTDLIRKNNIENIRSWIPQPDLFNVSNMNEQFFAADPLQDKLAKMHEKSHNQMLKHTRMKKKVLKKKISHEKNLNSDNIQFYETNFFKLHEFFEEINRKEDTFYLFSFKSDHLLLPAIDSQNFSQIIKMNLIMPRSNNESLTSDKITMMQIETIILNTSLIQITEKSIPGEFKPYSNATQTPLCNNEMNNNDSRTHRNLDGFEASKKSAFKRSKFAPYFGPLMMDIPSSAAGINSMK